MINRLFKNRRHLRRIVVHDGENTVIELLAVLSGKKLQGLQHNISNLNDNLILLALV